MPLKSRAQARWMFATHPEMAKEWAKETPSIKALPEKVHHEKKASFISGLLKIAIDLPNEAREMALFSQQDCASGQQARENMTTGQAKGRATNTGMAGDRDYLKKYKKTYNVSRGGGATEEARTGGKPDGL